MPRTTFAFTWFGILFGATFPLTALAFDWAVNGGGHFDYLDLIHSNPIHIIIHLAPAILGITFHMIGRSNVRLSAANDALETEVANRTQELVEALKVAEHASRAKSTFLANINHEFRTPLNAIIGFTEIAIEDLSESPDALDTERFTTDLQRVLAAASRLLNATDALLDYSKIESGDHEIDLADFDICHLIQEVCQTCQLSASKNGNAIHCELPDHPVTIRSDRAKIRQSLFNPIDNACTYTENGTISVRLYEPEQNLIRVEIADTGPGIPAERLDDLFSPFTRADGVSETSERGAGLGLSIAAKLVEHLGGTIACQSELGQGSLFILTFPVEAPPSQKAA